MKHIYFIIIECRFDNINRKKIVIIYFIENIQSTISTVKIDKKISNSNIIKYNKKSRL